MAGRPKPTNPMVIILSIILFCCCFCSLFSSVGGAAAVQMSIGPAPLPPITLPKGQFVKIEQTNPSLVINLTEFQVLDDKDKNISKDMTVTGTNIHPAGPLANLVDGKFDNFAHTNGPTITNDWIEIDLGSEREIKKFVIINRADCCKDRAIGIKVSILDKDKKEVKSTPTIGEAKIRYSFQFKKREEDEEVWK